MAPIVWRLTHVATIDSTNSWVAERAREGAPEGTAALADYQAAGRGRRDRRWEAPPHSALLLSVLLRPADPARGAAWAVAAVGLSARAALTRLCGLQPSLKWPNDLIVGDRKLGGVLAEYVPMPQPAVVVGIGLNLTAGPDGVGATTVLAEAGVTLTPRALTDILLEELEARVPLVDDPSGLERLRAEYAASLATLGRAVRVVLEDGEFEGRAIDVDESGRLVVDTGVTTRVVSAGDVVHLHAAGGDA